MARVRYGVVTLVGLWRANGPFDPDFSSCSRLRAACRGSPSAIVNFVRMAKRLLSRSLPRPILLPVVILSICALTGSLVTRTSRLNLLHCVTAQSHWLHAVHQHLDRDATQWAAPVRHYAPLPDSTFHSCVATPQSLLPSLILNDNLFNRPPPSC